MARESESATEEELRDMTLGLGPATRGELRDDIGKLVRQAHANGVTVDGYRFELRHDHPDIPDWEVDIWQLSNPDESGSW